MEKKTRKESQPTALTTDDLIAVCEMVDNAAFLISDLTTDFFTAPNPDHRGAQEYILGRFRVAKAQAVGLELMLASIQRQLEELGVTA